MARILIIGAGPAGMSTALFLAKMGIESTLVDKARFPRDKICGDGLSGWVLHMLYRLDPTWVRELSTQPGALPSNGMRFYAPNLKHLTLPYHNKKEADLAAGYIIRRKEFDSFLWQKVKQNPLIETIEGFEAVNFQLDNDSALVRGILSPAHTSVKPNEAASETSELRADMVVFCDGAASRFAQNPGNIKKDNQHHATGIKVYYRGLQSCDPILNPVEFYFLKPVLPGYLWIFPLPGGEANVGLGIRTDVMKRKKIRLKDTLLQSIGENPLLRERFKDAEAISEVQAWGLPLGSRQLPLSGERFLLA